MEPQQETSLSSTPQPTSPPPPPPPPPQDHQEPALKKPKMSSTTTTDDDTAATSTPNDPNSKPRRYKRRKAAIFFAYCGVGYQGMQKNPGAKTIEGDLEEAIYLSGGVPEEERGQHKRYDWARSARTDKGVSAVGQVVSGKFFVDPPGFVHRLNSILPPQIRIFGYKRVTPTFSAKKFCDRRRYVYLLPVFALDGSCHRDRESVMASLGSGEELVKCSECSERGRKVLGLMGNRRDWGNEGGFQSGISSNSLGDVVDRAEGKVGEEGKVGVCVEDENGVGGELKNDENGVCVQLGISSNNVDELMVDADEKVEEVGKVGVSVGTEVSVKGCVNVDVGSVEAEGGIQSDIHDEEKVKEGEKGLENEVENGNAGVVGSEVPVQSGILLNCEEVAPLSNGEMKEKEESTDVSLGKDGVAESDANGEVKKETKSEFKYGDEVKERFNRILKYYVGTHNFHNFTTRTKAEDPSAKRYILSFEANTTLTIEGIEFIKCEVVGQSFMLHQIRKMMGMAVAVMRNFASESIYETAFNQNVNINVPTAPEVGLYLDECFFTSYNNKWHGTHEEVSMKAYAEEAEEFKLKYIYSHIAKTEQKEGSVAVWLHSLNRRNYPDFGPFEGPVEGAGPSEGPVERAAEEETTSVLP